MPPLLWHFHSAANNGTAPTGNHRAEIRHITKPNEGKNKGHFLVGLKILEKLDHFE